MSIQPLHDRRNGAALRVAAEAASVERSGRSLAVRSMESGDIDAVVSIHLAAFPQFFLTSLGPEFLRLFFLGILSDPSGVALVAEEANSLAGYICGSSNPRGIYRRLLRARWWQFGFAALRTSLFRWDRLRYLAGAVQQRVSNHEASAAAELMSVAVDPPAQQKGIGRTLVIAFLQRAQRAGADGVLLTTDKNSNEAVNHFYRSLGFTLVRSFATNTGREMNQYQSPSILEGAAVGSFDSLIDAAAFAINRADEEKETLEPRHASRFLPFALPDIGEEEIAEVVDSLRSGWLTTGPKTKRFEEEFAAYLAPGIEAVAVNSGTSGLHLALEAAGVGPGDQVITTPYTFTATAEVVRYLGADPVFADIDEDTLNIDPDAIEAAITARTRAIIPVHFAGLACNMDAILPIAHRRGLKTVEDAAHSLPATASGRLVGTLDSTATVFSFYVTKPLATGEGGMIATRDPQIAARCRVMRLHGIDRDAFDRYTSSTPSWFYRVVAPGFKYNMTDIAASIGIHQLKKVNRFQRRREELAFRYDSAFQHLCLRRPAMPPAGEMHSRHLYVIRLDDDAPLSRDAFIEEMARAGIGTSVHFIPLHLHPYWRDTYGLQPEQFPNATRVYRQAVSLPIYSRMTEADQDCVIRAVCKLLSRRSREVVPFPGVLQG